MTRFVNVGPGRWPILGAENVDENPVPPEPPWPAVPIIKANALTYDYTGATSIYMGHFLEHLLVEVGRKFLRKLYSEAFPVCILAVTVPAWDRCQYADFKTVQEMFSGPAIFGDGWTGDAHRSAWRTQDVIREMEEAGWKSVHEWADCPWLTARVPWQVCVVGTKG